VAPGTDPNADFHYALGPEFYRLWLDDPLMMYTCAYWKEGTRTLEEAAENKIDHVARQLLLAPGEEVVDIGAASAASCSMPTSASGCASPASIPPPRRADMVRGEIERRRLGGTLQVLSDFRDAPPRYDKVVSIGTLEHAGRDQLAEVVAGACQVSEARRSRHAAFIRPRRAFPDRVFHPQARLPGRLDPEPRRHHRRDGARRPRGAGHREPAPHYALTLDAWGERFDRNWERIRSSIRSASMSASAACGAFYLYGCAEMFRSPRAHAPVPGRVLEGNVTQASYPMSRDPYEQPAYHRKKKP